jgi:hypothetical protein
MGVRFKLSTRSWYWARETPDSILNKPASEWDWDPKIDEAHAIAKELGIEMAGDLDGWWAVKASPAAHLYTHKTAKDRSRVSLNLGNWHLLGRYDDPEVEKIIGKYTNECVERYKDRIRYWKFHNEVNLSRDRGSTPEFYGHLMKVAVEAAREADPDCIIVNASMSGSDVNYIDRLITLGYAPYFDMVDVHNYSWGDWTGTIGHATRDSLITGSVHELLVRRGLNKPIVLGEVGHNRRYPSNGTLGQARQLSKWFTIAMTLPWVKAVCFGFAGDDWTVTDDRGTPFPAWVALRTTALLIDGADYVGMLKRLPVTGYVFRKNERYVTVLWLDADSPKDLLFRQSVTLVDLLDRRSKLEANKSVAVGRTPLFALSSSGPNPEVTARR